MPDIYRAADVLLFPTAWREPFGLVPLEAMATGCLVIATGLGGSGEFLRDEENAILIGVNDDRAAVRAVERLLGDPALVARLRAGGRDTVGRYSLRAFASGLDTVLDGLTAGGGAVPRAASQRRH
jgi:glycosyltransferase involved in cell wall biosynthesis